MNIVLSMTALLLVLFPEQHQDIQWGMAIDQLRAQFPVVNASDSNQYSYSDHMETEPDVYIRKTGDGKQLEYYFYQGRLYKIFEVHHRSQSSPELYKQLIEQANMRYGPAQKQYSDHYYGIKVVHSQWENNNTILDIRSGAGYVYRVYIHKSALQQKARKQLLDQSI